MLSASFSFLILCFDLPFLTEAQVLYGTGGPLNVQSGVADAVIQRILTGHALRLDSDTHLSFSQSNDCDSCGISAPVLSNTELLSVVDVPCDFPYARIAGAQLAVTPPVGPPWYMAARVVSESSAMTSERTNYVRAFLNGTVTRGAAGPLQDATQSVMFYVQNALTNASSNGIGIMISGPTSVTYDGCAIGEYPQMVYQVVNAPPSLSVIWDLPGNLGATQTLLGPFAGSGVHAPNILASSSAYDTSAAPNSEDLCVINYNFGHSDSQAPAPNQIGYYGSSTWQTKVCFGCQTLLVSATPAYPDTPYLTGSLTVQACGTDCSGSPPVSRTRAKSRKLSS